MKRSMCYLQRYGLHIKRNVRFFQYTCIEIWEIYIGINIKGMGNRKTTTTTTNLDQAKLIHMGLLRRKSGFSVAVQVVRRGSSNLIGWLSEAQISSFK